MGIWFCRALLGWAKDKLPSTTVRERFFVLLVAGWLPAVFFGSILQLDAVRGGLRETAKEVGLLLGAATAVGFPVMWLVARHGLRESDSGGAEVVASVGEVTRLVRAAFASAAAVGLAFWVISY